MCVSLAPDSALDESPGEVMRERLGSSLTYEQQVGLSSKQVSPFLGCMFLLKLDIQIFFSSFYFFLFFSFPSCTGSWTRRHSTSHTIHQVIKSPGAHLSSLPSSYPPITSSLPSSPLSLPPPFLMSSSFSIPLAPATTKGLPQLMTLSCQA